MTNLSILMLVIAAIFLMFVIKVINKGTMSLEYALTWLGIGIVIFILALFPNLADAISEKLGFAYTSNFLLFMAVMFCLLQLITMTTYISKQDLQIKKLIQEVSILKQQIEKEKRL